MAKVKLTLSNAGHNRWRLGLQGDASRYVVEFPLKGIIVEIPGYQTIKVISFKTYGYGPITHPAINQWIRRKGWDRIENGKVRYLPFKFSHIDGIHRYEYIGR